MISVFAKGNKKVFFLLWELELLEHKSSKVSWLPPPWDFGSQTFFYSLQCNNVCAAVASSTQKPSSILKSSLIFNLPNYQQFDVGRHLTGSIASDVMWVFYSKLQKVQQINILNTQKTYAAFAQRIRLEIGKNLAETAGKMPLRPCTLALSVSYLGSGVPLSNLTHIETLLKKVVEAAGAVSVLKTCCIWMRAGG